jgi:hypothetical protein
MIDKCAAVLLFFFLERERENVNTNKANLSQQMDYEV